MKSIKVKLKKETKFAKIRKVKLPKLVTRWVMVYLIALIPVIRLVQLGASDIEKFSIEAPFLMSSIVVIIACISVWVAVKSLKLTQNVMRPFLALQAGTVNPKIIEERMIFEYHVKNTGSVPANVVTVDMQYFDDAEVIEEDNKSKHYEGESRTPEGVVIFPGSVYDVVMEIDLSKSGSRKLIDEMMNGTVKLRFGVKYRAQGMEYLTVQTEKLLKAEEGVGGRLPIQPQRWT